MDMKKTLQQLWVLISKKKRWKNSDVGIQRVKHATQYKLGECENPATSPTWPPHLCVCIRILRTPFVLTYQSSRSFKCSTIPCCCIPATRPSRRYISHRWDNLIIINSELVHIRIGKIKLSGADIRQRPQPITNSNMHRVAQTKMTVSSPITVVWEASTGHEVARQEDLCRRGCPQQRCKAKQ